MRTNVSRVERRACRDIRVRDRAGFHTKRRDALGWNKRKQLSLKFRLATKNLRTSLKEEGREEKIWLGIDARPVFASGS